MVRMAARARTLDIAMKHPFFRAGFAKKAAADTSWFRRGKNT
jgi:hypothetical protein